MVSVFTKVGLALFVFGIILSFLIARVPIPFINGKYGQSISMEPIPIDGSYVDIQIPGSYSHPFSSIQMTFKTTILGDPGEPVWGSVKILYSNPGNEIFGELPVWGDTYFSLNTESTGSEQELTSYMSLSPKYASSSFTLYFRIKCDPQADPTSEYSGSLYLKECELEVLYTVFTFVLPPLCILLGIIIIIGGFFINYRKLAAKPKPTAIPDGWEPSLRMGTAFEPKEKRAPKMAVKSTKSKEKPSKKVVKKAVPKGGDQVACKYCGKNVSSSAFFCPHCFGKLR